MWHIDEILYKLQLLIDPAIKISILVAGLLVVFMLLKQIMPKMNVKLNPFQPLSSPEEKSEKREATNPILKGILQMYRALNRSGIPLDDRTILQNFFLYSGGSFLAVYFIYGFWTGLFSKENFHFLNIVDFYLIAISLFAACVPFIILYIRLHRVRVQNSYDLVPAIATLLSKYRYYKGNLYYAIFDMTKNELKGDIKTAFMVFLPALQGSGDMTIEEAVDEFYFRIPYERAIELGIAIMKNVQHGDDIEQSLNFMVSDMTEQRKINAKIKTENREMMQLAYLPVFLIPGAILFNVKMNGASKTFHYYFVNPMGVRYLILTIIVCTICVIVAFVIQRPRNEV